MLFLKHCKEMSNTYRTKEQRLKRRKKKKTFKIVLAVVLMLIIAIVPIIAINKNKSESIVTTPTAEIDVTTGTEISSDTDTNNSTPDDSDETVITHEGADNASDEDNESNEETETDSEADSSESTAEGGEIEQTAVTVHPKEYSFPSNAPKKGDNKTIMGLPKLQEVRLKDDGDLLVLVNKYHAVSAEYYPSDMVAVDPALGTWNDLSLKSECYEAYKKMYADAKAEGFNLKLCSAYRSYNTQVSLFNSSLASYGWDTTYIRSAYPGRSEHHTGLAIDITSASMGWGLTQDFADYEDGKWLNQNCQNYGFILRYPEGSTEITGYMYEPWHFRYVGVEVAKEIMSQGITLEEYLGKD